MSAAGGRAFPCLALPADACACGFGGACTRLECELNQTPSNHLHSINISKLPSPPQHAGSRSSTCCASRSSCCPRRCAACPRRSTRVRVGAPCACLLGARGFAALRHLCFDRSARTSSTTNCTATPTTNNSTPPHSTITTITHLYNTTTATTQRASLQDRGVPRGADGAAPRHDRPPGRALQERAPRSTIRVCVAPSVVLASVLHTTRLTLNPPVNTHTHNNNNNNPAPLHHNTNRRPSSSTARARAPSA